MTIIEMLGQSGILTVLGMGVVFAFLIIMIAAMTLLHKILVVFKLDVDKPSAATTQAAPTAASNNSVIAAIATALHVKK